jgi:MarR-like DNA-binding transcriptional regulator SgrR of sgrS sRNA
MLIFNQRKNKALRQKDLRETLYEYLDFDQAPSKGNEPFIRAYGLVPNRVTPLSHRKGLSDTAVLPKRLRIATYQMESNITLAKWVASSWQGRGIECHITVLEYPVFSTPSALSGYDVFICGEVFDENIELSYYQFFYSNYLFDTALLKSQIKQLHNYLSRLSGEQELMSQLQDIEDSLLENLMIVPLSHTERDLHVSHDVSDFRINAYGWMDFCKAWLRPQSQS